MMNTGYKQYMSYFQKVTTVGILTCGQDHSEAEEEARLIMKNSTPVERCFYDETPFELSDSEEWNPDIDIVSVHPTEDSKQLEYTIKTNVEYSQFVADSCGKKIEDLTDKDFEKFFLDSMAEFIAKGEKKYGKTEIG
jgi:hypothetical protein